MSRAGLGIWCYDACSTGTRALTVYIRIDIDCYNKHNAPQLEERPAFCDRQDTQIGDANMIAEINWNNFKAKFYNEVQSAFERLCYLLRQLKNSNFPS